MSSMNLRKELEREHRPVPELQHRSLRKEQEHKLELELSRMTNMSWRKELVPEHKTELGSLQHMSVIGSWIDMPAEKLDMNSLLGRTVGCTSGWQHKGQEQEEIGSCCRMILAHIHR
jgi:hypothetical protein